MAEKKASGKAATSKKSSTSKSKTNENEVLVCNTEHLAKMFGVSTRQIYNQIDNGIAVKIGANKFDCVQSVANYINYMREQERIKRQSPEEIRSETEAVKLEHEKLKARKTELQVLQMEGKLHYEEDVKSLWNSSVIAAKSRLNSIGVKVAPQIRGETNEAIIQEFIDREVHDALKEVSAYDASKFEKDYTVASGDDNDDKE